MDLRALRERVLVAMLATAAAASVLGAEEPLATDRPDFTEGSATVGKGVVHIESGFSYDELAGGEEVTTVGEALVRWGALERLELRLLLPTYARERARGTERSGFVDPTVGCKLVLAKGGGRGVLEGMEASLVASSTVPTASGDFANSSWQPAAVLAAGWELGERFGLGANLGVSRPADDEQRFTSTWLSAVLGIGLSEPLTVFVELIGFNREEARGPSTLTFQAGALYLLGPDFQLDLRAARRLTDQGSDVLVGAGISLRLGG